jgi:hypothetical protein
VPSCPLQQARFEDPFVDQSANGPSKPLNRPRIGAVAIEHADYVAPRLVGSHTANGGQPGLELAEHPVQMRGIPARAQFADRGRVACAQAGIAANPSAPSAESTRPGVPLAVRL